MNLETGPAADSAAASAGSAPLHALCIARHCFLSEHIARYFAQIGVVTDNAVGIDSAAEAARDCSPDVVICDYDVLANLPIERWERDALLSKTPVIAVSLTRRAEELHLFDMDGIAGFLYLPTLQPRSALQILAAAASRPKYTPVSRNVAPRTVEHS